MADFKPFAVAVNQNITDMSRGELYVVAGIEDIFGEYLAAFPEGTNPIYRERTEHDCACCKGFIRNMGAIVSIENGALRSIWDSAALPAPYDQVAARMSMLVKSKAIGNLFRTSEGRFGAAETIEVSEGGSTTRWNHFHGSVAPAHKTSKPDQERGDARTTVAVMKRGFDELSPAAVESVLDLIDQNQLYRGGEFAAAVKGFKRMQDAYLAFSDETDRMIYCWRNLRDEGPTRFRNSAIGTLVTNLSDGMDLEEAVRRFEAVVAPQNYKRPTSLITHKMIDDAVAKLTTLGLDERAIERRHAKISDITVNNVLFVDNRVRGAMADGITGLLKDSVRQTPVIHSADDISIEDFLANVVPQANSLDLLLENKHLSNFVSLTAPAHADGGRIFQWDNGFAWSYDGDAADSVKQRVKRAGGNVDADLRVSLSWFNYDDLDLHAETPGGFISFRSMSDRFRNKILDVDMNAGSGMSREPVENMAWMRGTSLLEGHYRIMVDQFSRRETIDFGFQLEMESDGQVATYTYDKPVAGTVSCLEFVVSKGIVQGVRHAPGLKAGSAVQEKWGVSTGQLIPIDTMLLSPNHWDGQQGRGNKHWFFVLKGCKNPDPVRGIYNEYLRGDLTPHRKVFEVLGAKTKCPVADDQLSGVGFSSARGYKAVVMARGDRLQKAFTINF